MRQPGAEYFTQLLKAAARNPKLNKFFRYIFYRRLKSRNYVERAASLTFVTRATEPFIIRQTAFGAALLDVCMLPSKSIGTVPLVCFAVD